jgi:putative AlgH/UPF0301 family transcriptional regulator
MLRSSLFTSFGWQRCTRSRAQPHRALGRESSSESGSLGRVALKRVAAAALALALVVTAALAPLAAAAAEPPPNAKPPATVPVLAASVDLEDTVWGRTVILVTPLPAGAHLGIILNRPTRSKLGQLFPSHAPSQRVIDPVYFGGPMSPHAVIALIQTTASPGHNAMAIAHGVYLAVDAPTIDQVIEQQPDHARFFVGFLVWAPSELEEQVAAGFWTLREAEPAIAFRKDVDALWREVAGERGGTGAQRPAGRGRGQRIAQPAVE